MLYFSVADIQDWIGCTTGSKSDAKPISIVAADSREVIPGAIFVALPGAKTDGHLFLESAAQKGASYAIVKDDYAGSDFGMELWRVPDTLKALQTAGQKWLQKSPTKVIAITGSLGKTTTKGFVYQMLKTRYRTTVSSGNKNTKISLPLVLLNETSGNEQYLVLEMGMTEPLQIQRLTEIAPPDIALITDIALMHAAGFSTIEDIAEAKSEIFSHPKTQLGIYSADSAFTTQLQKNSLPKKTYSRKSSSADWHLEVGDNFIRLHESGKVHELQFRDFLADHLYTNLLAAISVAMTVGMSVEEISRVIPNLQLPERRLQEVTKEGIFFISDCYNASSLSMQSALKAMRKKQVPGKKVAVLGGMRELGKFSEECHREVALCALDTVDEVICIGPECAPLVDVWKQADRQIHWYMTFEELLQKVRASVKEGDVVLLKGARPYKLERVLENYS